MTTRRTVTAKDGAAAIAMLDAERRAADAAATQPAMRRCIGSKTFGIEAHEAPIADFPVQPSQKDGLGRMCKPHWNQYTTALRKAAQARKAAEAQATAAAEVARRKPAARATKGRTAKTAPSKAPKGPAVVEVAADAAPAAEA
jgi:hypothetical protein